MTDSRFTRFSAQCETCYYGAERCSISDCNSCKMQIRFGKCMCDEPPYEEEKKCFFYYKSSEEQK